MRKTTLLPPLLLVQLLSLWFPLLLSSQDFSYSESNRSFTVNYFAPPSNSASTENAPKWRYFLETGDGHYHMGTLSTEVGKSTRIEHTYREGGNYEVSLFLSPMYALANTKEKVSKTISVGSGSSSAKVDYNLENSHIHLVSNANEEAIANHKMRFALHHNRYPGASEGGYLIFFYNHIDDSDLLGFDPFIDLEDEGLYYQEAGGAKMERVSGPLIDVQNRLNSTGAFLFKQTNNDYNDAIVFRSHKLTGNESRRAFFSLQVNPKVDYKRQKNYKLQLAAVWIPDDGAISEAKNLAGYELKVERIHDPNKIEVTPRVAYYRKGYPKELNYKIIFKNTGRGQVRHSKIGVSITQDLLLDSLKLMPELVKPFCRECEEGFDEFDDRCIEIEKLSYPLQDSVYFSYYNIGLNKREEGEIAFSILSRDRRPANSKVDGQVVFRGGKPDPLRAAKVQWRHKSLHFHIGYLINQSLTEFDHVYPADFTDRLLNNFSLGLEYQNAALGTGRSWGYGVKYTPFHFRREFSAFDQTYLQVDTFTLRNIDVYAMAGYQFKNSIRVKATGGVALPVLGDLTVDGLFDATRDRSSAQFGVLQSTTAPAFYNQELSIQKAVPGFSGSLGVEFGEVHSAVVGIRQEIRIYPKFYHGKCATISNTEIYLRFKLSAIGGKW